MAPGSPRGVLTGTTITLAIGASLLTHLVSRDPYPVREYQMGIACLAAHEYQSSVDHLTRSLAASPSQPETLFARAQAFAALGNHHDAIRDLTPVDKIAEDGKKLAFLAYCCNCLKSHAEAVSIYEQAIKKGCRSAGLYNNLGYSHYTQGRLKSALKTLDMAVAIDTTSQVALHNRAIVQYSLAIKEHVPPDQAVRDIESVMTLGACSGDMFYSAAMIFAYATSFDVSWKSRALVSLRSAIERGVSVDSIESDVTLAQLYHESNVRQAHLPHVDHDNPPIASPLRFLNPLE